MVICMTAEEHFTMVLLKTSSCSLNNVNYVNLSCIISTNLAQAHVKWTETQWKRVLL